MSIFRSGLALLLVLSLIPSVMAADNPVENHPGFVDFSSLAAIAAIEPNV